MSNRGKAHRVLWRVHPCGFGVRLHWGQEIHELSDVQLPWWVLCGTGLLHHTLCSARLSCHHMLWFYVGLCDSHLKMSKLGLMWRNQCTPSRVSIFVLEGNLWTGLVLKNVSKEKICRSVPTSCFGLLVSGLVALLPWSMSYLNQQGECSTFYGGCWLGRIWWWRQSWSGNNQTSHRWGKWGFQGPCKGHTARTNPLFWMHSLAVPTTNKIPTLHTRRDTKVSQTLLKLILGAIYRSQLSPDVLLSRVWRWGFLGTSFE